jgi:SAM-dependent methyltransferase
MFDTYAEIFAERGASYHRAMAEFPRARDSEFRAVLEPLGVLGDGVLCDLPSGGGYLAEHVPSCVRYVGVDPSHDFIEACPPGLERIEAPITEVPLPTGAADYIVCLAALHHEPDLASVFSEMRRLLKGGGRAILADVAVDTAPAAFLNGFLDRNNPMGHDGRFLDERLTRILEDAGFRIVDDRLMPTPWQFDSRRDAGAFCRNLFWMPDLSADEVADAIEQEIGLESADGTTRVQWVLRRVVGEAA